MAELVMLRAFLNAYEREPWTPGDKVDCCLALAEWAIWMGRPDPAAAMRGTYQDEQGFRAHVNAAGSLVALVGSCVSSIGARRVDVPICGDIAVIGSSNNIHRQFGAIYDGRQWLVRFIDSIGPMTAKPLAIWRY